LTVYADWCGPCKTIAPIYEGLSTKYSRAGLVTFAKVNTDDQKEIAQKYGITALAAPSFVDSSDGNSSPPWISRVAETYARDQVGGLCW
jgi:thiol-disulfide isomerase/thioredoxin